ncbi:hypothetical protein D3A95_03370 [Thermosynechococcus sichuanensis E542]|uniref:Uncharacterized protein n=1 Tax=Thermosynechococcus sichuanensis E542 TaxID=2016101 RepID=A0A3B7MDW7_9CYAN|nr:hypothetical protein D3A95_03370 [Thermosynechococcus vestitus E542]
MKPVRDYRGNLLNSIPRFHGAMLLGFAVLLGTKYFALNWRMVWVTATQEVALLRAQIVHVLEQLGDDQLDLEC